MAERLLLPEQAEDWWGQNVDDGKVVLCWRGGVRLALGDLRGQFPLFRYEPTPDVESIPFVESDLVPDAERFDRLFAKTFARAGWHFPACDPRALESMWKLRAANTSRLELIVDTNAMVEGIGHWLATLFADRCDLVISAVSLRELQDLHGSAQLSSPLADQKKEKDSNKKQPNLPAATFKKVIHSRQTYLAAMRFRELCGHRRVLWRELELDDSALLLSRGGLDRLDKKTSEADTLMLREVRRHIRDSVRGLERFFVTADTALARRATTELPAGRTIASRVRSLGRKRVYTPLTWWPGGPDEGQSITGHTVTRLIWELLAVADWIELLGGRGRWKFSAFTPDMWPSDFESPWLAVESLETSLPRASKSVSVASEVPPSPPSKTSSPILLFNTAEDDRPPIEENLRIASEPLLLSLLAIAQERNELPSAITLHPEARRHLSSLLEKLQVAKLSGRRFQPLDLAKVVKRAFATGDRELISWVLRPYRAYAEQAGIVDEGISRPKRTVEVARTLAERLGQGMFIAATWLPGGANPILDNVRTRVLRAVQTAGTLSIYDLLVDTFLRDLHVSPIRALNSWDRMEEFGVFAGFEFRKGGSPDPKKRERFVRLTDDGIVEDHVQLDTLRGYRDVLVTGK